MQSYNLAFVFLFFVLVVSIQCHKSNPVNKKDQTQNLHDAQFLKIKFQARYSFFTLVEYHKHVYGFKPLGKGVVAPLGYINSLTVLSPFATGVAYYSLYTVSLDITDGETFVAMQSFWKIFGLNSVNIFYQNNIEEERKPEIDRIFSNYNVTRIETLKDLEDTVKEITNGELNLSEEEKKETLILNLMSFEYTWLSTFQYENEQRVFKGTNRNYSAYFMQTISDSFIEFDDCVVVKFQFTGEIRNFNGLEMHNRLAAYFIIFNEDVKEPEITRMMLNTASEYFKDLKIEMDILIPPFQVMGESTIPRAKFPNIVSKKNSNFPMFGKEVDITIKQSTHICVDDIGTVKDDRQREMINWSDIGSIKFDRPFYYVIVEEAKGNPIFYTYVDKVAEEKIKCAKN